MSKPPAPDKSAGLTERKVTCYGQDGNDVIASDFHTWNRVPTFCGVCGEPSKEEWTRLNELRAMRAEVERLTRERDEEASQDADSYAVLVRRVATLEKTLREIAFGQPCNVKHRDIARAALKEAK